jgi:hypothetical protein
VRWLLWTIAVVGCVGCGDGGTPESGPVDSTVDAPADSAADASLECREVLGSDLTPGYGRLDGTLRSIAFTYTTDCPSDDNHIRMQVEMNGEHYEVWINVESTIGTDRRVYSALVDAPLYGLEWEEGLHTRGVGLDYVLDLDLSSNDFTPMTVEEIETLVADEIDTGHPVSVYMDVYADGTGGHKVHRNVTEPDGALVTHPRTSPRYLAFRFAGQTF